MAGYDIVFILKVLSDHNDNNNNDQYKIDCIFRDNKILKVSISKTINNNKRSYCMLNEKLSKLAIKLPDNVVSTSSSMKVN